MIILTILEVFMIIVMGIWQWTIHVVAFFVHGFQVEMKFGMLLFRVGRMIGESGGKKKTEQGREGAETQMWRQASVYWVSR